MSQPAARLDMRAQMPETAAWVDQMRQRFGKAHVNHCIREALAGKPGFFYAFEQGHTLGTPFPPTHPIDQDQRMAVMIGAPFAGFIAEPVVEGGADAAN